MDVDKRGLVFIWLFITVPSRPGGSAEYLVWTSTSMVGGTGWPERQL